jgi:hypothetical protein
MSDLKELEELRYVRVGWQDYERPCDAIAKAVHSEFEGEILPLHWQWRSLEHFLAKYGETPIMWAKSASFHMMLINGFHVLRIWTDSSKSCFVDVNDVIYYELTTSELKHLVEPIPTKCVKKSKPMNFRLKIKTIDEAKVIVNAVKRIYGLGST